MQLAQLELDPVERDALLGDLDAIVHMIDAMQSVDTEGIAPLAHPVDVQQPLREDEVIGVIDRERLQAVAPVIDDGFYLVPRVVE